MNDKTPVKWSDHIKQVSGEFQRISKDNNLTVKWTEEKQFAIQALQKNALLAKCVPYTVQNAIVNVAAVGLTLNPADGYAYLVPEYNKTTKQNECQLRISFKGLIKAATDTGAIQWVRAEIVKKEDKFEYTGPCSLPIHTMDAFSSDRGRSIGVYCVAKTNEGDYLSDIMPWSEVEKIKACAKTQMVWDKWPDEMAKKAIIKRAAKQWPRTEKSAVLHKAIEVVNDSEGSDFRSYTDEEKQDFDRCVEAGDSLGLVLFAADVGERTYTNLYNSGEKGKKCALKDKCREMEHQGRAIHEIAIDAIKADENMLLLEQIEDCLPVTINLFKKSLSEAELSAFNEMTPHLTN